MTPEDRSRLIYTPEVTKVLNTMMHRFKYDNSSVRSKLFKLKLVADYVSVAADASNALPCKPGCSACCHQAVIVGYTEAEEISKATGHKMAKLPLLNYEGAYNYIKDAQDRFYTVPCVFLKDDLCSIYPDRPLPCRTHFSVEDTPEPCTASLENKGRTVAYLDTSPIRSAHAELLFKEPVYDLRDWFPVPPESTEAAEPRG